MTKNPLARKLSLYFALLLITFALINGGIFMSLFRKNILEIHKAELLGRARTVAGYVSGFMAGGEGMHGGYGAYLRLSGDLAGADVWVVDREYNLVTAGQGHHRRREPYQYKDLPPRAGEIVGEVFGDREVFSKDFSSLLAEPTLTVGVPVKDSRGTVSGVVLLHSPVRGMNRAFNQGIGILLASILTALIFAFVLSHWLSKRIADPITAREAAVALRMEKIRRDFLANVSHELKTPVTVIRGSLEALRDQVVTRPEKVAFYHQSMLSEAIYLERLVQDLLELSRLQNTDFAIEKQEIYLKDLFTDAIRSAGQLASGKNIEIRADLENAGIGFLGDYGRLRQMLMVVLGNAIKFSPENSEVEVTFAGRRLTVRDQGPGIASEDLPWIFDRFYKSRPEENKSGTGLGLAIAKEIARRHGIGLSVNSAEGQGAAFVFDFGGEKRLSDPK